MAQEDKHGRSNVRRRGWEPVQLCRGASVCEAGAWGGATTSGGERSIGYICLTGQKFKFFLEKKKIICGETYGQFHFGLCFSVLLDWVPDNWDIRAPRNRGPQHSETSARRFWDIWTDPLSLLVYYIARRISQLNTGIATVRADASVCFTSTLFLSDLYPSTSP